MSRLGIMAVGGLFLLTATAALAQPQAPGISGQVEAAQRTLPEAAPGGAHAPQPLFYIGNLPVEVWAPVPPLYDTTADRNGASNPLWGTP